MKSVSVNFVLAQLGGILLVSIILGVIMGANSASFISGFLTIAVLAFIFLSLIWFIMLSEMLTDKIMEKTMDRESAELGFQNCSTFYASNSIIRIEEETGRIAYVAAQNPFHIQVAGADELSNIKTDYVRAPLGGTSYVYFQFKYNGKVTKVPTFTSSHQVYSLKSSEVLEGISKGDKYCEILLQAQENARG